MKKLFEDIATIQPTIEGWCSIEKANALAAMCLAIRPNVVVEIGVYGGSSFVPMALALKHIGLGTIHGIDPWSPNASVEGYKGEHVKFWGNIDHEAVYQRFLKTVDRLAIQNVSKIHRMKSDDYDFVGAIDLAHVDGQHSEQASRDVNRYASKVRVGGFVILDDLIGGDPDWSRDVHRAEKRLLEMGFKMLYTVDKSGFYTRIR